jgi:hypothetical protein
MKTKKAILQYRITTEAYVKLVRLKDNRENRTRKTVGNLPTGPEGRNRWKAVVLAGGGLAR